LSYTDYDQNTLSLVLDLASLGDGTLGLAELAGRQREMFAEHGYRGEADIATRLKKIGGRLAAVLAEPGEEHFLDALAQLLEEQDCKPYLTRHDGTPHLHYARDGAPFAQWAPTMAVAGLVLYVCRNGRSRLRRCAAADCGWWFADTSRNSSRRYCEHACASRTTVAAFRARRQRAAAAGTMQG
jgi:predicted RNA-binding Zn ribbon-like protein